MDLVKLEVATMLEVVGARLKAARVAQGLSREDLAAEAGISNRHLYDMEGGNNMSLKLLHRLCTALELPLSGLFVPIPSTSLPIGPPETAGD